MTIVTRNSFHKQESPPAGNCKRRTDRGITCPSLSIRGRGVPPSNPSRGYPYPYPHPVVVRACPIQSHLVGTPIQFQPGGTHPVPARVVPPSKGYPTRKDGDPPSGRMRYPSLHRKGWGYLLSGRMGVPSIEKNDSTLR